KCGSSDREDLRGPLGPTRPMTTQRRTDTHATTDRPTHDGPLSHVPAHTPPGAGTPPAGLGALPPGAGPGFSSARPARLGARLPALRAWKAGHPEPEPRGGPPDGRLCHMGIACRA